MINRTKVYILVLALIVLAVFIVNQTLSPSANALGDKAKSTDIHDVKSSETLIDKGSLLTKLLPKTSEKKGSIPSDLIQFEFKDPLLPLSVLKEKLVNGDGSAAKAFVMKNRECYAIRNYDDEEAYLANYAQGLDMEYQSAKVLYKSCAGGVLDYQEIKPLLYQGLSGTESDLYLMALIELLPNNFNERHQLLIEGVRKNLNVDDYLIELFAFSSHDSREHYFFAKLMQNKNIAVPPSYKSNMEQSILDYEIHNGHMEDLEQLDNLAQIVASGSDKFDQQTLDELFLNTF
jgi:hypothetical protein